MLFYLIDLPLLVLLVSLVYSATRFEQWSDIGVEVLRWIFRLVSFLVMIGAGLWLGGLFCPSPRGLGGGSGGGGSRGRGKDREDREEGRSTLSRWACQRRYSLDPSTPRPLDPWAQPQMAGPVTGRSGRRFPPRPPTPRSVHQWGLRAGHGAVR